MAIKFISSKSDLFKVDAISVFDNLKDFSIVKNLDNEIIYQNVLADLLININTKAYKNLNSFESINEIYLKVLKLSLDNNIESLVLSVIYTPLNFDINKTLDYIIKTSNEFLQDNYLDLYIYLDLDMFMNDNLKYLDKLLNYINVDFKADNEILNNVNYRISYASSLMIEINDNFASKLNEWLIKKNIPNNIFWKKANIDRRLFSKIYNGSNPSKNTAILIGLALELNISEFNDLLSTAGYVLSKSIKEDIAIRWHIENGIYSFTEIWLNLEQLNLKNIF